MELIHSDERYNYWRGFTDCIATFTKRDNGTTHLHSAGCGFFYNVLPKYITNPNAGYPDSDYICRIKGVKNIFKK